MYFSVERDKAAKQAKEKDKSLEMEPSLEDWLAKRAKRLKKDETVEEQIEPVQYQLPPFLMNIPSLPPSLLPPTLEDLKNTALCDWGWVVDYDLYWKLIYWANVMIRPALDRFFFFFFFQAKCMKFFFFFSIET